jgi:holo-[acyl-carrier protein] synthase
MRASIRDSSMVLGVGVDLLKVERIEKICAKNEARFADKILSSLELADYPLVTNKIDFLAKRFAAKEAVSKALGTGMAQGISWKHMTLSHTQLGQPRVTLIDAAQARLAFLGAQSLHISLSDDAGFVTAYAVIS